MKTLKSQKFFKILVDLKFAIGLLLLIAFLSSIGSIIEQDESPLFYQTNYQQEKPLYGFLTANFLLFLGLDHIYQTWWFLGLLVLLGFSLVGCTITRQFPLVKNSKRATFKKEKKIFNVLPFFVEVKNKFFFEESLLLKLQNSNFCIFQHEYFSYAYKGLIGRISPILVHISLIFLLIGSSFGALKILKAEEFLPKGEIFHIQNLRKIGAFTTLPKVALRINDFWIDYENGKIHQFYSNLSLLDNLGNEKKTQTISVNNPLRYKDVDFYQSDWKLVGIRLQKINTNEIFEYPLFSLKDKTKIWITWIKSGMKNYTLAFDQLENTFFLYDEKGQFLLNSSINEFVFENFRVLEILPSSGILIKSDPSIPIIYAGFGGLMITTILSFLPFTQLWITKNKKTSFLGANTNRGKIQLEIEFENFLRSSLNEKKK